MKYVLYMVTCITATVVYAAMPQPCIQKNNGTIAARPGNTVSASQVQEFHPLNLFNCRLQ